MTQACDDFGTMTHTTGGFTYVMTNVTDTGVHNPLALGDENKTQFIKQKTEITLATTGDT